eukprot:m.49717 g.49717  ORF g.49717 m.49717 type:complete len:133 (+) comp8974_c0_seq2:440-838(+)
MYPTLPSQSPVAPPPSRVSSTLASPTLCPWPTRSGSAVDVDDVIPDSRVGFTELAYATPASVVAAEWTCTALIEANAIASVKRRPPAIVVRRNGKNTGTQRRQTVAARGLKLTSPCLQTIALCRRVESVNNL